MKMKVEIAWILINAQAAVAQRRPVAACCLFLECSAVHSVMKACTSLSLCPPSFPEIFYWCVWERYSQKVEDMRKIMEEGVWATWWEEALAMPLPSRSG